MKLLYVTLISCLIIPSLSFGDEAGKVSSIFGGDISCATFIKNDKYQNSNRSKQEYWLLGFWSGMNVFNKNGQVGFSTDSNGLIGEVQKYCKENPSTNFVTAISLIYKQMEDSQK